MNHVILQVAATLDGYIARKDDRVDFLDQIDDSFLPYFNAFIDSIETIIMGRKTYEVMLTLGDIPYKDKTIYVLSSKNPLVLDTNVTFTNETINSLLKRIKGNIWLFGGAKTIQSFLQEDLVDELQLFIVPKMIGQGIPLFLDYQNNSNWNLVSSTRFNDNLFVIYKKIG